LDIGISFDSDINCAIKIIQEQGLAHPNCIDARSEKQKEADEPIIPVRVLNFGESSINLRAYIWSKDSWSGFLMKCDLFKAIKEEFDKNKIEIPFPYRTLVYKQRKSENEIP
jgi:small-conductance mechanosensitive channel